MLKTYLLYMGLKYLLLAVLTHITYSFFLFFNGISTLMGYSNTKTIFVQEQ